ncbi:hypothetical protein Pmar_PMAR019324 [Perkinsus marinus ATCC 50983]|uniref:Uncharacterized protein n=1 Tax=Perkinsus marinus (strain ATCC 50983 / TXsc) TaxID=423536 RepID=C5KFU2_PERM5|nr:hypothetical protein Pmar_PMAR015939 [Perkinsus marinus ATCC 50983]XP_002784848.1 hypothetical protein Pmar_PMAR019324 [Perkinsus marinus ATCC 50983]EER08519.1 hypothetical protein Pmar_PMAR015939 [Perkinsus marinus ATCC 50983]EER16644.1 hypothetical protein Pmar_PMAR019324 [Perkinsus marinus ATCC 50983]|eukprot:XP_002776703.1 hypothetical protein Pmar_PMAR015939 [Perkinsus marinus ATCC 50983]
MCLKEAQRTIVSMVAFEAMMSDNPLRASGWAWGSGQHQRRPHYSKPDINGIIKEQLHVVYLPKSIQVTMALEPLHKVMDNPMSPLEELGAAEMK